MTASCGIRDPESRLRAALAAIYPYFRRGAPMLGKVLRDESALRELAEVMVPWWSYLGEVAGGLAAGWAVAGKDQRLVRASVGHALDFHAWRSLVARGLTDEESVDMMVGFVTGVAERAAGAEPSAAGQRPQDTPGASSA